MCKNAVFPASVLGLLRLQGFEQRYNRCSLESRGIRSRDSLLRGLYPHDDGQIQPGLNRPISAMAPTEPSCVGKLSLLLSLHNFHPPLQNVCPYLISAGRWELMPVSKNAAARVRRHLERRSCNAVFLSHQGGSERIRLYASTAQPPQLAVKGERYRENPLSVMRTLRRIDSGQNLKASLHGQKNSFRSRTTTAYVKAFLKATVSDTPI